MEKDKAAEKNNIKTEDNVEQIAEEEKLVIDVNKFDINKIEGYTPGENIESKDSSESITVGGMSLPYSISNENMEITSIGKYSGKFVEDGSDVNKDNI